MHVYIAPGLSKNGHFTSYSALQEKISEAERVKPKRIWPSTVVRPDFLVVIIQKPGLGYLEGAPGLKSDFPVVLHGKSDSQTRKHRTLFIPEANVPVHNIFLSRPEKIGCSYGLGPNSFTLTRTIFSYLDPKKSGVATGWDQIPLPWHAQYFPI